MSLLVAFAVVLGAYSAFGVMIVCCVIKAENPPWIRRWFHRRKLTEVHSCPGCGSPVVDGFLIRDVLTNAPHSCDPAVRERVEA